jgi:hypothetical protein
MLKVTNLFEPLHGDDLQYDEDAYVYGGNHSKSLIELAGKYNLTFMRSVFFLMMLEVK